MALRSALLLVGVFGTTAGADGSATCSLGDPYPLDPALIGYNLEAFVAMMPNYPTDTGFQAILKALKPGSLRYPGGTMSNVWDLKTGRYVPNRTSFGFDWDQRGYVKFAPFAKYSNDAPEGTFSAAGFADAVKGLVPRTIYDLNVFTMNTSETCDRIAEIARIHSSDGPNAPDVLLELGNELYIGNQGLPRFPTPASYIEAMVPIAACATSLLGDRVKLALVGSNGEWSQGLGKSSLLDKFDAISAHEYSPSVAEINKLPRGEQISHVAGSSRAILRSIIAGSNTDLGTKLPIWHTEFNYGILPGATPGFLPDLEFGALHGMFHAGRILAALNSNGSVKVLQFQTLVHPANYSAEPIAFHDEMPVTRLAAEANRPDLALVAGTGQLVAHLSHLVIGVESNVTPMHCSGPVPGPVISGEPQPCIQAAKFDSAGRTTYAVLNICNVSATVEAEVTAGQLAVTTYSAEDPGGWAPLPTDPTVLPWSAPLKPTTATSAISGPSTSLTFAPLSFSLHVNTHP